MRLYKVVTTLFSNVAHHPCDKMAGPVIRKTMLFENIYLIINALVVYAYCTVL